MKRAHHQQGATLLLLLMFLLVGAGVLANEFVSVRELEKQKQLRTQNALDAAKKALIAYAVTDENRPGELPCPDIHNDGKIDINEDMSGGDCVSLRGWMPWFLLRVGDIRDGDGERLWYAVSDAFKPLGSAPPTLNPDTQTDILINNVDPADDPTIPYVAAVIIAPGDPLSTNQGNRVDGIVSGSMIDDLVASYLENNNSGVDKAAYTRQPTSDNFNDTVVTITVDEIMRHVENRVKREVINAIKDYQTTNGFYPYAETTPGRNCAVTSTQTKGYLQIGRDPTCPYANVLAMPVWFEENDWHRMFWYAIDPSCRFGGGTCTANLAVGSANAKALILYAGKALDSVSNTCGGSYSQSSSRPSDEPCDYFDNSENYNTDDVFEPVVDSATSNDELIIIN